MITVVGVVTNVEPGGINGKIPRLKRPDSASPSSPCATDTSHFFPTSGCWRRVNGRS